MLRPAELLLLAALTSPFVLRAGLGEGAGSFLRDEAGAYVLRDDAQGLIGRVDERGLIAGPADGAWSLTLRTTGFGRDREVVELVRPRVTAFADRIELDHGALLEWFVPDPNGIEQGWTILEPPSLATAELRIELALAGLQPRVAADGRSASLHAASGVVAARYVGLSAYDASGAVLPARIVSAPGGMAVLVDDSKAAYPVTVDPILTGPAWSFAGGAENLGFSVSRAGDVNGDGYDDVLVGAPSHANPDAWEGRALVFHGSASGPSVSPDWSSEGNGVNARHGTSVSCAGDVNGDGYEDVIVGSPQWSGGESDEGRALVYLGSSTGLFPSSSWTYETNVATSFFGNSVSGAGDVNDDGFDDVLVSAPHVDNGAGIGQGRVFLFLGSAGGLSSSPDWVFSNAGAGNFLGTVSCAGDVNDDGFDDVLLGLSEYVLPGGGTNPGYVLLFLGSAAGPAAGPDVTLVGPLAFSSFGQSVSGAGDLDGDGFDEVVVADPLYSDGGPGQVGRVWVFPGGLAGTSTIATWMKTGTVGLQNYGIGVSGAGDTNGDGYGELLIGSWHQAGGSSNAYAYLGAASGPNRNEAWIATNGIVGGAFGYSVSCAGDANGDGRSDVIVGSPGGGRAYVYFGAAASDCNANGVADEDDIAAGTSPDCNANGVPDECDLASGASFDCDTNGVPDECEADCNGNGVPDDCDLAAGTSLDCNTNGVPDECDLAVGASQDCNANAIPDECDLAAGTSADCNMNSAPDECDLASGTSLDCNADGVPDECQTDCNGNGVPDDCDLAAGTSQDCNANATPDECDIAAGASLDCNADGVPDECQTDCNGNGVPDDCDLAAGTSQDCNANAVPDECDIAGGTSLDCNANGTPDDCETDCNANGVPDDCDIASGASPDCNSNGVPDGCDLAVGASVDCDGNGVPDECDIASGTSQDCDLNGVPDECDIASGTQVDCNGNGVPDSCDLFVHGTSQDCNANFIPDECDIASGVSLDCNGNGVPDDCDLSTGTSEDANGNGVPDECDTLGMKYCVGAPNSHSALGATVFALGSDVVADNDLTLQTWRVPNNIGVYFYGPAQIQIPFGDGFRCVGGTVFRVNPPGASSSNVSTRQLDLTQSPHLVQITPGSTWNFQLWYRDPMAGLSGFNLSDGVSVTFQ